MRGVRVFTWEHDPTIYELRNDKLVRLAGPEFGPVEVSLGDADWSGLEARVYTEEDGEAYIRAIAATFKGSRKWAVPIW
jgi:hypothetical protein